MKRLFGWSLVVSVAMVGLLPTSGESFGRRRGGCESSCYPAPCLDVAPCYPGTVMPAPEIRYEERTVNYLKPVWRERVVEDVIVRCQPREEKFVYDVQVPAFREEKRTVRVTRPVTREEKVVVKVCSPVHAVEKRNVTVCVPVWNDVEYTYTVAVPKFRQVARTVQFCNWETKHVETMVPVCRVVPQVCTDECGRCYTVCRTVTEMQPVTRCVRVPVMGTREVMVNECYYENEVRKGVRRVCNFERREQVVDVTVCRMEYRDVEQTRVVCDYQTVEEVVPVRVCHYETQKREGVRIVHDRVEEKVKRTVRVCEYENVTETIRVPVSTGAYCNHGYVDCGYGYDCGGRRRCCR